MSVIKIDAVFNGCLTLVFKKRVDEKLKKKMVNTREVFEKDKKSERTEDNNSVRTSDTKRTPYDTDSRNLKYNEDTNSRKNSKFSETLFSQSQLPTIEKPSNGDSKNGMGRASPNKNRYPLTP